MKRIPTKAIGLGVLIGMALALWLSPAGRALLSPTTLVAYFRMMEAGAVILFVAAHIVATVLGFPGSVLVVVGGAVFGLVWGLIWSVVGATLGAIAAFWLARYLLRDWVERRLRHHPLYARLSHAAEHRAWLCVFVVRFIPISPFSVVNFVFGLTPMPLTPYAIGTLLGIVPGTLAYTWLGLTGYQAIQGNGITGLLLAIAALVILTLIPILARWVSR